MDEIETPKKTIATPKQTIAANTLSALQDFNSNFGTGWTLGENWSNVSTQFETFINKYLFPKISETAMINIALGNRFDWLAKEVNFIAQYSEEYVIMDTVPVTMNLSKAEELMLKRNYPRMATRLYGQGILKKVKFTLNNNDVRFNFLTLQDATSYALAVFRKAISDINVSEEIEIKAMLIDYSLNNTKDVETVTEGDINAFTQMVYKKLLNIQNNSDKYNEANLASGGAIGRYTTVTDMRDVAILTNDDMKAELLGTQIAQVFQVAGIDPTHRIISFDDMGGVYKLTADVTVSSQDTVNYLQSFGDYQTVIGDIFPEGTVFTFDITSLTEFTGNYTEVKPPSDTYAYIFDINKIRYRRNTKGMLKEPFYNGEFDEVNHWIHYYSFKAMSPFFNNCLITVTGD